MNAEHEILIRYFVWCFTRSGNPSQEKCLNHKENRKQKELSQIENISDRLSNKADSPTPGHSTKSGLPQRSPMSLSFPSRH